jgi:ATP-dependent exoDNAse (exonuclease V) beta subunit
LPQIYQVYTIEESEEKNLFFVCLTRAKKQLHITNYSADETGKIIIPSSFVNEIKDEYKESFVIDLQTQYQKEHVHFLVKSNQNQNIKDKDLVKQIFTKNGLSVTAFNNYLACP